LWSGCGAGASKSTIPYSAKTKSTPTFCPELSELDLEKLGVPLGHRKRLLKAIAGLRDDTSVQPPVVTLAPAPPPAATQTGQQIVEPRGERRHVTVMFCDPVV
jgi:hypothetical protein